MTNIAIDAPDSIEFLMGNEAIARGALEAGIGFASAYPGTPSTEIIGTLAQVGKELNVYVEWSTNEKVALESAAAASFAGVRALAAMKQVGVNVAVDFLMNMNLCGVNGGFVLVACDDPGALASQTEQDTRLFAKWADFPLIEPATFQEAKDMTRWAFELSEEVKSIVILRGMTRISHGKGSVNFGKLPQERTTATFDTSFPFFMPMPVLFRHQMVHDRMAKVKEVFESSPFNSYTGPDEPDLLVISGGSCWLYAMEAVKVLGLEESVGILKLGTIWPVPEQLLGDHLKKARKILILEHIEPFLEGELKIMASEMQFPEGPPVFYGKRSGHIDSMGEITLDVALKAMGGILGISLPERNTDYRNKALTMIEQNVPPRDLTFCPGCPHRATFWSIKNALKLDGRDGFVAGDIGCYALGAGPAGYFQVKTLQSMGSGTGVASGFGNLGHLDFRQPVISVCGDSTFFHTAMPALMNGVHNQSDFTMLILDNAATAMTGFQPHPGSEVNAAGDQVFAVDIEGICRSLGIRVEVGDPFDLQNTEENILALLEDGGKVRAMILRGKCAQVKAREGEARYEVHVDENRCIGEGCGCARLCTRVFRCPAITWDGSMGKAKIDETICNGCGVCADICPQSAIVKEAA
ncbi:MAG: thiamine pyrophosphate-dependent enzyme [Thermodesulfobacteriota bacterium]|nr:thiamine pyrophosphate-dependent enzyme [Thermodesulfobacteriota bacterium]